MCEIGSSGQTQSCDVLNICLKQTMVSAKFWKDIFILSALIQDVRLSPVYIAQSRYLLSYYRLNLGQSKEIMQAAAMEVNHECNPCECARDLQDIQLYKVNYN